VALAAPAPGVAVWTCDLARHADDVAAMAATLSPAELARAGRFGRADLRARYVVGRATLRVILGRELGVDPSAVPIVRGRRGRPQVAGDRLDFNVSHTNGVALIALTRDARVGVDLEHGERTVNVAGVARKFMSPAERERLDVLSGEARRRMLLRLWTCKEAMSKATGDALAAPFRQLTVVVQPALALAGGPAPYEPSRWRLVRAEMPGDYLATVALWHGAS
jgi:4'-phosphopantetheinyl transferase